MKPIFAGIALILGAAGAGQVYDWGDETAAYPEYADSMAICRSVRNREPPLTDRPDAATAATLAGCDSAALYYGIGMPADPIRARQCAFLEEERGEGGIFAGRWMLMTIYANGDGAVRDLDVATHLACGIDGAPAESHGRVTHLVSLKDASSAGEEFHFCDDITSGLAMGYCAAHSARIDGARRDAAIAAVQRGWSLAQRQAFAPLLHAHAAYVEAHGSFEVDMSGTARAAMQIGAEEVLRDQLLTLLQGLTSPSPRFPAAAALRAADARLNLAYRQRLSEAADETYPGAVTRAGIRDAERAWLRYRDAALRFTRTAFPAIPPDRIAAWLTERRRETLTNED